MCLRRGLTGFLVWGVALGSLLVPLNREATAAVADGRPYGGAATWVSIFSGAAVWDHPARHVRAMHQRGVHTLFLQTASSRQPVGTDLFRPSQLARFIHAAHARGMQVVAWYLPPLRRVAREHARAMAAITFRTGRGQRFDGFSLDIEPSATTPRGATRDENLRRLSRRIRASAGEDYPLGAVIPSPLGMAISTRFWPEFPYETIGRFYDVVLPMSYYTYRVRGAAATYSYTMGNVAFLRERLGQDTAIHMIGGNAGDSNGRETAAFVRACNDAGVVGASLWHYANHGPEDWRALRQLHLP